ncbi:hypothetical protein BDV10DRAFT_201398 [Aspergillus recurvatus]
MPRFLAIFLALAGLIQGRKSEIGEWLDRLHPLTILDFKILKVPVKDLESHLTLRSYVVGHSFTLADIVIWRVPRGNRVIAGLRWNNQNINRWFTFFESAHPWLSEAIAGFNRQAQRTKTATNPTGANYNNGLKNTENGIVCRFPPEPSGYLHIGHAKATLLNDYFAHGYGDKRGVLICRFDDIDPSRESQGFQNSISYDLSLLGVVPDRISYSSDYFQQMYEACIELINVCRDMSVEETLAHFQEMKSGSPDGFQWCIRAKISVDDVNKALRDPQVTHALRAYEHRDRNPQYYWIQNVLGLREVEIWDFSTLDFIRTVMSKRKLNTIVNENVVWGWDDPRMPTVPGDLLQGLHYPCPSGVYPETRSQLGYCQHGLDSVLGCTKLVFYRKEILISQNDARSFKSNESITLVNWGNAIVSSVTTDTKTRTISALQLKLDLESDPKKTEKKITWLAKDPENMVPVDLYSFGYLITKGKIEKDEEISFYLTNRANSAYAEGRAAVMFNIPTGKGA